MTKKEIQVQIWMLQQDNLHRGDMLERSKDEKLKNAIINNMNKNDKEIERLRDLLKQIEA